ncbi:formate dehydrogenase subunit gamma [Pseudoduganella albidiflava]|uniref:Formate dehydrogenase cytochrome b556 (FDO) subunit n=1 Tax=Pseudoduganella albidiflava TaxID=321983 RepID=A0AA88C5H8_9BURK|nr:formate dehydrogenase subunit gamma [Pseudoduganella albidiflava]GGY65200.1 formate dehydrogenase cytochrome b556 (FDO) subunit [Pseudoduganella albidiflava]
MNHDESLKHDEKLRDKEGYPLIERYKPNERTNHWITAISFVLLAVSGLALFHPAMSWMAVFLGGGQWTRILHPFIGIVMFVSFLVLVLRFWHHNFLDATDRQWLKQMDDVLANREEKLPRIGKYNAGQKLLFWVLIVSMVGLLLTGIVMWRAWFSHLFAIDVIRVASLLHAFFAFVIILSIIVHVYAGIWIKGSMGAMIRGTVTYGWARKHHPRWFEDEMRKRKH